MLWKWNSGNMVRYKRANQISFHQVTMRLHNRNIRHRFSRWWPELSPMIRSVTFRFFPYQTRPKTHECCWKSSWVMLIIRRGQHAQNFWYRTSVQSATLLKHPELCAQLQVEILPKLWSLLCYPFCWLVSSMGFIKLKKLILPIVQKLAKYVCCRFLFDLQSQASRS